MDTTPLHKDILDNVLFGYLSIDEIHYLHGEFDRIIDPMHFATEYGYLDLVKWALWNGARLYGHEIDRAARYGHIEVVKFLGILKSVQILFNMERFILRLH